MITPLRSRALRATGLARLRIFASATTSLGEICARGDEDGEGFGIVLGLRNQVGGDIGGVGRARW